MVAADDGATPRLELAVGLVPATVGFFRSAALDATREAEFLATTADPRMAGHRVGGRAFQVMATRQSVHVAQRVWGVDLLMHVEACWSSEPASVPRTRQRLDR